MDLSDVFMTGVEAGSRERETGSELARFKADFASGGHRSEDAGDDLGGAGARHLVGRFCLEKFGVGQNDSELIIEAMEEQPDVARIVAGGAGPIVGGRHHEASFRVSSPDRLGSRHSVSTKIRTDPPAVR